jgi:putative flippase GtrA
VLGRIAGAVVGIVGSRRFVFKSQMKVVDVVIRLMALLLFLLGSSYGLMLILVDNWHLNVYISRVLVDSALFIVNFLIQRDIIFRESAKSILQKVGLN